VVKKVISNILVKDKQNALTLGFLYSSVSFGDNAQYLIQQALSLLPADATADDRQAVKDSTPEELKATEGLESTFYQPSIALGYEICGKTIGAYVALNILDLKDAKLVVSYNAYHHFPQMPRLSLCSSIGAVIRTYQFYPGISTSMHLVYNINNSIGVYGGVQVESQFFGGYLSSAGGHLSFKADL
jgi:hypothetical protein